ncbi:MAG: YidC/Oxa1 family membrane protein insertase [Clostridia bacterium]|nr:YidC/Oxa1 family membrane protein insertase [Clostridia bacterium]
MVILTQSTTFIIGPIANLLGYIMNWLFLGLDAIGIPNIGLAIIIFTFVTKLLMMPLTVKQMKFTKLSSVMQPEIQAIQKKYKGKESDQNAMLKMQEETKAVYAKYGTSPTGGCVQLLIQMPILFALYRVIQNIPAYVPRLKSLFTAMLSTENGIMSVNGYENILRDNFSQFAKTDLSNMNSIIDVLNVFSTDNWNKLIELFPAQADVISHNLEQFNNINSFLTINMSQNPGLTLGLPILIPILAGVTQYISVRMMQAKNQAQMNDEDNPAAASMKMMNTVMPIMSAVMAISLPAGLGLYWSATAVFQILQQLVLDRYFDKKGVDEIVKENLDKVNKKRAKQGLPEQKITNNARVSTKSIASSQEKLEQAKAKKEANDKKIKEILDSTEYYKSSSAKPGSLAAKANMVSKYNEKNNKK